MRTIAIAGQKGGTGKTAVAAQLAWGLSSRGMKTLVIDFDPQSANVTAALGAMKSDEFPYSTRQLLLEPKTTFAPISVGPNLDLCPANIRFAPVEFEVQRLTSVRGPVVVARAFQRIEPHGYEFVVCDCPPNFSTMLTNVLAACTEILSPVCLDRLSVQAVDDLQAILGDLAENPFVGPPQVTFLPTFYRVGQKESEISLELAGALCARQGGHLSPIRIPDATAIAKSAALALPISHKSFNDSPAAQQAFQRLVEAVAAPRPTHAVA